MNDKELRAELWTNRVLLLLCLVFIPGAGAVALRLLGVAGIAIVVVLALTGVLWLGNTRAVRSAVHIVDLLTKAFVLAVLGCMLCFAVYWCLATWIRGDVGPESYLIPILLVFLVWFVDRAMRRAAREKK